MLPISADTAVPDGGRIRRPQRPEHWLVLEPLPGVATAVVGDEVVASSRHALVVRERSGRGLATVVYFPPEDVRADLLVPTSVFTRCPLKGEARSFDITTEPPIEGGAWSYQQTHAFDPRLVELECRVAFDEQRVRVEVALDGPAPDLRTQRDRKRHE